MKDVVIFGAGAIGQLTAVIYKNEYKRKVVAFVDNNTAKIDTEILGIPVISFENYVENHDRYDLIVCANYFTRLDMDKQLKSAGIQDYTIFNENMLYMKERILSWSEVPDCEDVILYHALKDENDIFWIDVGCNDPDIVSSTKLFYDRGWRGINIDIRSDMIDICNNQRQRDINLNIGLGSKRGEAYFYEQGPSGALSTLVESNIAENKVLKRKIEICTLEEVCDKYATNTSISFLKIDVEGMEKDVLLGADFNRYRPLILVIESTMPCTDTPNYEAWENIVLDNRYHFVYSRGNNRFYVADEASRLDERFVPWPEIAAKYYIHHAGVLYTC